MFTRADRRRYPHLTEKPTETEVCFDVLCIEDLREIYEETKSTGLPASRVEIMRSQICRLSLFDGAGSKYSFSPKPKAKPDDKRMQKSVDRPYPTCSVFFVPCQKTSTSAPRPQAQCRLPGPSCSPRCTGLAEVPVHSLEETLPNNAV